jgi:hypothetical protein
VARFLNRTINLIGMWFSEIKEKLSQHDVFKRDWTTSLNTNNYSTFDNLHDREDLCIQLRNQQTCTSNNHDLITGGPIWNMVFARVSL